MTTYAWHVHHTVLCEPLTEPIENRIKYIKEYKPAHEVATRLRLLKVVENQAAVAPARKTYDAALASAQKTYNAAVAELHAKECPNCPWNGRTIFPEEVK